MFTYKGFFVDRSASVSPNFFNQNRFSRFWDISKKSRKKKPLFSCTITILDLFGKVKRTTKFLYCLKFWIWFIFTIIILSYWSVGSKQLFKISIKLYRLNNFWVKLKKNATKNEIWSPQMAYFVSTLNVF